MRRSILFTSIYVFIFLIVSIPLILNIRINELSNRVNELDKEMLSLEIEKVQIDTEYHKKFSVSSIEKLARTNSYQRLEIYQKINKLEIPYKLKNQEQDKVAILGFGK
tara:strand:+ start:852 stop:1175 length:324 start_codon:yes stop_codon:yes gene_type:complete